MSTCNLEHESVAHRLIHHFYYGSLNFHLKPEEVESFTWEKQQKFLNATIHNKTVIKYPLSSEFSRLYFKKIIDLLEPKQEVHDDFYTFLCSVLKNNTYEDFCYKHYMIGNDLNTILTIKETKNMVVNGTTGMRTWQAALMLADFMICNKDLFQGKNILELGSGVGFTGIAIAKYCDIKSIILTDCHNDVLKTIYDNILINFPSMVPEENEITTTFRDKSKNIGLMMLDWNCVEDLPIDAVPDVLIGADIIYDPAILKPLCDVIKTFIIRNNSLDIYIANVIRNEETYKSFLDKLDNVDLACEEVSQMKCVLIEWDCSIQRCLLKIKKKDELTK